MRQAVDSNLISDGALGPRRHVLEYEDYDIFTHSHEIDVIIDDKLYLGGLSGAKSSALRTSLGITHIVSVCPNYPSTGPDHLQISLHDSENENLLIHLPKACQFIQTALDGGGKVLVHCVMGVSRSSTVVSAYLMWTRHWTAEQAIAFVQTRRRCVHPNYGFIRQLQAFGKCEYEPSSTNDCYMAWKRHANRDAANYVRMVGDTIRVAFSNLYLNSDFPKDPEQADLFLVDTEVSHLLTISPSQTTSVGLKSMSQRHLSLHSTKEALLLALPEACDYIREGLSVGRQKRVLVHCQMEIRACIVIAAYLMLSKRISVLEASSTLERALLPLFEATPNFIRHLELFEACDYVPTKDSPAVQSWVASGVDTPSEATAVRGTAAAHVLVGTDSPRFS